jgi:hypothetical protein
MLRLLLPMLLLLLPMLLLLRTRSAEGRPDGGIRIPKTPGGGGRAHATTVLRRSTVRCSSFPELTRTRSHPNRRLVEPEKLPSPWQ